MDFALILFIALIITGAFSLWDRLVRSKSQDSETPSHDPWYIEYSKAFFPVILLVFVLRSFKVRIVQIDVLDPSWSFMN